MLNLKPFRARAGLSQQGVAKQLGVSRSTVAMWETGGSEPDNMALLQLSALFGATVDELLGNENKFTPAPEGTGAALTEQDLHLLQLFAKLSDEDRGRMLERAEMLAAQTRGPAHPSAQG